MATKKQAEDKSSDRVDEESREAVAEEENAAPFVRNPLWQSGNVSTNDPGPRTEDVSHLFAEARAAALGEAVDAVESGEPLPETVVLPEDGNAKTNDEAIADLKDASAAADARVEDGPDGLIVESTPEEPLDSKADEADQAKKASGEHK